MKHTDRYEVVDCPKCHGEGGEVQEVMIGAPGLSYGYYTREEWSPCETCEGDGTVQRVDRLAWLIGEARELEARLAPLTMPVVVREAVTA